MDAMDTYLVGGAVRDRLLGLPEGDRDWVVVGQTPEAMLARGIRFSPELLHKVLSAAGEE